jgi:DNA-binding NarL/FixJ family response regulator
VKTPYAERNLMLPKLTNREIEILRLVAEGLSNKKIARHLTISEATAENHIHHIFQKLAAKRRTQAVFQAVNLRIINMDDKEKDEENPS